MPRRAGTAVNPRRSRLPTREQSYLAPHVAEMAELVPADPQARHVRRHGLAGRTAQAGQRGAAASAVQPAGGGAAGTWRSRGGPSQTHRPQTATTTRACTRSRYWSTCFSRAALMIEWPKSQPPMVPCARRAGAGGSVGRTQETDGAQPTPTPPQPTRQPSLEKPTVTNCRAQPAHHALPVIVGKLEAQQLVAQVCNEGTEGVQAQLALAVGPEKCLHEAGVVGAASGRARAEGEGQAEGAQQAVACPLPPPRNTAGKRSHRPAGTHSVACADLRMEKEGLPACACSASSSAPNSARSTLPLPSARGGGGGGRTPSHPRAPHARCARAVSAFIPLRCCTWRPPHRPGHTRIHTPTHPHARRTVVDDAERDLNVLQRDGQQGLEQQELVKRQPRVAVNVKLLDELGGLRGRAGQGRRKGRRRLRVRSGRAGSRGATRAARVQAAAPLRSQTPGRCPHPWPLPSPGPCPALARVLRAGCRRARHRSPPVGRQAPRSASCRQRSWRRPCRPAGSQSTQTPVQGEGCVQIWGVRGRQQAVQAAAAACGVRVSGSSQHRQPSARRPPRPPSSCPPTFSGGDSSRMRFSYLKNVRRRCSSDKRWKPWNGVDGEAEGRRAAPCTPTVPAAAAAARLHGAPRPTLSASGGAGIAASACAIAAPPARPSSAANASCQLPEGREAAEGSAAAAAAAAAPGAAHV